MHLVRLARFRDAMVVDLGLVVLGAELRDRGSALQRVPRALHLGGY